MPSKEQRDRLDALEAPYRPTPLAVVIYQQGKPIDYSDTASRLILIPDNGRDQIDDRHIMVARSPGREPVPDGETIEAAASKPIEPAAAMPEPEPAPPPTPDEAFYAGTAGIDDFLRRMGI